MQTIPFSVPYTCRESAENVRYLVDHPTEVGKGVFTRKCIGWMEEKYRGYRAYLTTSCTRSLELIALGLDLQIGDEIILSPYTYVGVANAFANYGARLVFVDILPGTMNIDASLIEAAITPKTRAVIAMHYSGVGCEMEAITALCSKHDLVLIEDNAQGIEARYNDQLLGTFGDFSCLSFDLLKNISCNDGGALLFKEEFAEAMDVAFENGTNKSAFLADKVDAYEWIGKGSKFSMSEYTAAVLYPLLQRSLSINGERRSRWDALMERIGTKGGMADYLPKCMFDYEHNGHIAYLKFESMEQRNAIMDHLNRNGIQSYFHYVSLDRSVAGRTHRNTGICHAGPESDKLLRLPMHNHLTEKDMDVICRHLIHSLEFGYI